PRIRAEPPSPAPGKGNPLVLREAVERRQVAGVRDTQGLNGELLLAVDVEDGPTRDQNAKPCRRPEDVRDDGRGREDLLEVVEHEKQVLVAELALDGIDECDV